MTNKKPKFKPGQVVALRAKPPYPEHPKHGPIVSINPLSGRIRVWGFHSTEVGDGCMGIHPKYLRPLTKKERGD